MEPQVKLCPKCKKPVLEELYYCPNCGRQLKVKPPSTSLGRQIIVYLISILLPPFGLWPAMLYLRQEDSKSKSIGAFAMFLTVVSAGFAVITAIQISLSITQQVTDQMQIYRGY